MSSAYSREFRDILRIIGRGKKLQRDLTREESYRAMHLILSGEASPAQIGGFMVTMRVKEETAEEIIGFTQASRERLRPFDLGVEGLIDFGFPYNGRSKRLQTGIIATMVLAASGVPILLHGADDIPTKAGVATLNLLHAMGYPAYLPPHHVKHVVEHTHFGVLDLQHVLPEWTALTPYRHHFGVRTFMNTVEKFLNPSRATTHISGFFHGSYLVRMANALPAERAWIVQGDEGMIDFRMGKRTRFYHAVGDEMVESMVDTTAYGFSETDTLDFPPNLQQHADCLKRVLDGEPSTASDQVALTAGVLLHILGRVPTIEDGIEQAKALLTNGKTADLFTIPTTTLLKDEA